MSKNPELNSDSEFLLPPGLPSPNRRKGSEANNQVTSKERCPTPSIAKKGASQGVMGAGLCAASPNEQAARRLLPTLALPLPSGGRLTSLSLSFPNLKNRVKE